MVGRTARRHWSRERMGRSVYRVTEHSSDDLVVSPQSSPAQAPTWTGHGSPSTASPERPKRETRLAVEVARRKRPVFAPLCLLEYAGTRVLVSMLQSPRGPGVLRRLPSLSRRVQCGVRHQCQGSPYTIDLCCRASVYNCPGSPPTYSSLASPTSPCAFDPIKPFVCGLSFEMP